MPINYTLYRNNFLSADGNTRISYYMCMPNHRKPRSVVQIVHGMCDCFARYGELAEYLTAHGYVVCGHDQIGHGESLGEDGMRGYFAHRDGDSLLVKDTKRLTAIIRENIEGLSVTMMGFGMGSFIARRIMTEDGEQAKNPDAYVLVGTSGSDKRIKKLKSKAKFIALFRGETHRSKAVLKSMLKPCVKALDKGEEQNAWITSDKERAARRYADSCCSFVFTLRGFCDLFSLVESTSGKRWAEHVKKDTPILLMSGDSDPVGDSGKGVREVYNNLLSFDCTDVKMILFRNSRHEIFNETCRNEVYASLVAWLREVNL